LDHHGIHRTHGNSIPAPIKELRQSLGLTDHGKEVGIARPAWKHVHVDVAGHAGAGHDVVYALGGDISHLVPPPVLEAFRQKRPVKAFNLIFEDSVELRVQEVLEEKLATNNHATWWTAQAAAYATFTGDASARKMCWEHFRNHLIKQIEADGSCPREEERTQSLSYSSMNLDAFSVVCRLAELDGVDLWHFVGPKNAGVVDAFRYLVPFMLDPSSWKKEQIEKYNAKGYFFPGLAGSGLQDVRLLNAYSKLPHGESPWLQFIDLLISHYSPRGVAN
jgi:hypothetical protein